MSSLPCFRAAEEAVSLLPSLGDGPLHAPNLLRRYESVALGPDGAVLSRSHVAPAIPLFEEAAAAFARGTLLPTPAGPVAIEDLLPGDLVESSEGPQPVLWIGTTPYLPGDWGGRTSICGLSRVMTEAPDGDLLLGPAARMAVSHARLTPLLGREQVLVPVTDYADGERILRIVPQGPVQLYHLVLPRHATLRLGGLDLESYHPAAALARPQGAALRDIYLSMMADCGAEALCAPGLLRTTREVVESLIDR